MLGIKNKILRNTVFIFFSCECEIHFYFYVHSRNYCLVSFSFSPSKFFYGKHFQSSQYSWDSGNWFLANWNNFTDLKKKKIAWTKEKIDKSFDHAHFPQKLFIRIWTRSDFYNFICESCEDSFYLYIFGNVEFFECLYKPLVLYKCCINSIYINPMMV